MLQKSAKLFAVTTAVTSFSLVSSTLLPIKPASSAQASEIKLFSNQNYCVDVQSRRIANGTPIQLWPCNGTPAQIWEEKVDPNCGIGMFCHFQIRLKHHPEYCLDYYGSPQPPNPSGGTPLHLWECTNANWWTRRISCDSQCFAYFPLNLNQAMDLRWNDVKAGTRIQLWPDNDSTAQKWK